MTAARRSCPLVVLLRRTAHSACSRATASALPLPASRSSLRASTSGVRRLASIVRVTPSHRAARVCAAPVGMRAGTAGELRARCASACRLATAAAAACGVSSRTSRGGLARSRRRRRRRRPCARSSQQHASGSAAPRSCAARAHIMHRITPSHCLTSARRRWQRRRQQRWLPWQRHLQRRRRVTACKDSDTGAARRLTTRHAVLHHVRDGSDSALSTNASSSHSATHVYLMTRGIGLVLMNSASSLVPDCPSVAPSKSMCVSTVLDRRPSSRLSSPICPI